MKIQTKKLTDLKPAKYNTRSITDKEFAGLVASLEQYGYVDLLVVNKQTGYTIVGGNQRFRALKHLGYKEVDVVVLDIPLAEEKSLNVVLNDRNIQGNYTQGLEGLLEEIRLEIPDIYDTMNLDDVVSQIVSDADIGIGVEDDSEKPIDKDSDGEWVEVMIGNIKGKIPVELYDIILSEHDRMGTARGTKKLTPILEAIYANSATTPLESIS